jgi:hypothetical protein
MVRDPACRINRKASNTSGAVSNPKTALERSQS